MRSRANLSKIWWGASGLAALCALPFVLAQPAPTADPAGVQDYEEVFSAGDTNGIVYIDWLSPWATNEPTCADWFLGAYKIGSEYGSGGVTERGSMCVDLDRVVLTNNLRYALHCSYDSGKGGAGASRSAVLFFNLLDTNGIILAESENLLTSDNVSRYVFVFEDAEIQSTNTVLLVNVPTAEYSSAAILQLRSDVGTPPADARSGGGRDRIIVYQGLLYVDEDGDGWTAEEECGNGTSDYSFNSHAGGIGNYDEYFNTGGSTNNPDGDGDNGGDTGEDDNSKGFRKQKIIYVDQVKGNDSFTGRAPAVSAQKKGPKKTVCGGLTVAEPRDTIIIKTGNYNENLNISGKDVKVIIEGKVRL